MFKNAILHRISQNWTPNLDQLEKGLQKARFSPCGATQESSFGWIEPRGEAHGPYVESVGGQWLLKMCIETKKVPAAIIQKHLIQRLIEIEKSTGRKPGRKESKELKEEIKLKLLPQAFPSQGVVNVWIDPQTHLLVVDAGSQSKADGVITALVEAVPDFGVAMLQTNSSPASRMSEWLVTQEPPAAFNIDRECELKAPDETKAVVKYGRHQLDIEEVKEHIQHGKVPTKLAITWNDRVSIMLTDNLQIKKITFLEGVYDGQSEKDDGFDANVAIMTGELSQMIPDLIAAHDGETEINL